MTVALAPSTPVSLVSCSSSVTTACQALCLRIFILAVPSVPTAVSPSICMANLFSSFKSWINSHLLKETSLYGRLPNHAYRHPQTAPLPCSILIFFFRSTYPLQTCHEIYCIIVVCFPLFPHPPTLLPLCLFPC